MKFVKKALAGIYENLIDQEPQVMTLSESISLISSIAALATSVIALFNVVELIKQRKQSVIPEVIFKEGTFEIYNGSNSPIPLKWIGTNINDYDGDNSFQFECYNIGIGPCKKVRLTWSYDVERFIEVILRNNNEKAYQIEYDKENQVINISMKTRSFIGFKDLQDETGYILPVITDPKPTTFRLPMTYHVFCSILLDLYLSQEIPEKQELFLNWPDLKLEIKYNDVAGNEYKRSIIFRPRVIDVKRVEGDFEYCAKGWFKVIC